MSEVVELPGRRRRRRSPKRMIFAAAAITIALLLIWLIWFSSVLSVRSARVEGVPAAQAKQVLAVAEVPMDTPLARVDTGAIAQRVTDAFDWIESVDVRRGYPSDIVIAVAPRTAIAVSADGKAIDASGVVYESPAKPAANLPVIDGTDPDALAAAITVRAGLPAEITAKLASMSARSMDDIRFTLRSGSEVRWGSAEQGELKARVLTALLARRARMYDVSAPELPTTFDENPRKARPSAVSTAPAVPSPPASVPAAP